MLLVCGCATGPKPPVFKREYSPVDAKEFKYEDKNIIFTYTPVTFGSGAPLWENNFAPGSGVPVKFVNKTDKFIKIIWDETAFINPSGQSEKVIHEGVKLVDRNAPMAPSLIPPKASLTDIITPVSRVIWNGTSWEYRMICGEQNLIPFKGFEQKDEECVNKVFGIFMAYVSEGKPLNFMVKFKMHTRVMTP